MVVDRGWAIRNLGFDPIASPPPAATFALAEAAARPSLENLQREIIEFDSEAPHGREFLAYTTATGLSRFTEIGWPKRLAPRTTPTLKGRSDSPLPQADVLVVTWTVDEGHATSRVLTPGKDSRNDYRPYTHNYASISSRMVGRCPARQLKRLGTYWTATIAKKSVLVFKSDSHMSQDGPQLPNIDVWRQIISEVRPKLVLTTGTAGGIGKQFEVGDVVVSPTVRFDCKKKFKSRPFHDAGYWSVPARTRSFAVARRLFKANAAQLPKENARLPKIFTAAPGALPRSVVTTDFFGFDTSNDYYGLQGLGYVSEMGDAVLGLVCQELGAQAPRYVAVRNVSDPQISAAGMTLREQASLAAQVYKAFGRWSTVCSAIACWALIVAE
jgi:hypothetical protein